jgi:hypothetical protein
MIHVDLLEYGEGREAQRPSEAHTHSLVLFKNERVVSLMGGESLWDFAPGAKTSTLKLKKKKH